MTANPMHPGLLHPGLGTQEPDGDPGANPPEEPREQSPNGGTGDRDRGGLPINSDYRPDGMDPDDQSTWYWPGRYQTPEDVARAKMESDREGQRLNQTVQSLQADIENIRGSLEDHRAANPPVPQGPDLDALKERLANAGIDGSVLEAFDELANWRAQEIVQQTLAPLAQAANARNSLIGEHPSYAAEEQAMWQYLGQNPSVKRRFDRMYASDPEAALEWGYTKFQATRAREAGGQPGAAPPPPNAMPPGGGQADNRRHGQVIGTPRSASTGQPAPDERWKAEQDLWNKGVRTGDYSTSEYANSRLGFIDDPNSPAAHPILAQLAAARGGNPGPGNPYGAYYPPPPIGGGSR